MESEPERTAFAKACAYLNYNPVAEWTAYIAGAGSCLVYVALLMVLWLFADLTVSRGRLPTFHDVPVREQNRFLEEWSKLPAPETAAPEGEAQAPAVEPSTNERVARLKLAGYDEASSMQLASLAPAADMNPTDLDALWRARARWRRSFTPTSRFPKTVSMNSFKIMIITTSTTV